MLCWPKSNVAGDEGGSKDPGPSREGKNIDGKCPRPSLSLFRNLVRIVSLSEDLQIGHLISFHGCLSPGLSESWEKISLK